MLIDTCRYTCNIALWLTYTMSDMQYVRHAVCQTCSMSDMQYVRHAVCQTCSMSDIQYVRHSRVCHRRYVRHPYVWWLPRWNALCLTDWALSPSIDTTYSAHLSAMVEYFACETFLSKQQCGNLTAWNLTIWYCFIWMAKGILELRYSLTGAFCAPDPAGFAVCSLGNGTWLITDTD